MLREQARFVDYRTCTLPFFILKEPALSAMKLVCLWLLRLAKQIAKWWVMHSYPYGTHAREGVGLQHNCPYDRHYIKVFWGQLFISLRSWRDFVRRETAWTRVAKPWEDWWRVEFIRGLRPRGNMAAPPPLPRSRIPPATQASFSCVFSVIDQLLWQCYDEIHCQ